MNNSNIPFRFYDHIAVIFPGTILLGIILFIYPEVTDQLKLINEISSVILIFVVLVGTYICGHTSYTVSKIISDFLWFNQDKFKELSEEKQKGIINGIEQYYETDFGLMAKLDDYRKGNLKGSDIQIKNYCFSVVDFKQIDHDKFVSLADFSRSVSINFLIVCIIYLIYWCSGIIEGFGLARSLLFLLGLGFSRAMLFKRSIRFRMAADSIIYSAFLAFIANKQKDLE